MKDSTQAIKLKPEEHMIQAATVSGDALVTVIPSSHLKRLMITEATPGDQAHGKYTLTDPLTGMNCKQFFQFTEHAEAFGILLEMLLPSFDPKELTKLPGHIRRALAYLRAAARVFEKDS